MEHAIQRLGLSEYADRRAGTLSLGNLQRLSLARALLHEPSLLVLDEPANGLDPAGVIEVRELLRSLAAERGVTIFMSSHILAEVDRLATRIGIVHAVVSIEELDSQTLDRHREQCLEVGARHLDIAERELCAAGYCRGVERLMAATHSSSCASRVPSMPRRRSRACSSRPGRNRRASRLPAKHSRITSSA